jgi:hypothetical protein
MKQKGKEKAHTVREQREGKAKVAANKQAEGRWQEGKRPWDGHGGTRAIKTTQGLLVDQRMFEYLSPSRSVGEDESL